MAQEPRLARHEIALIKAMLAKGEMPKDRIQAFFTRPDRTVNYGRIHNIETGKIGAGVEPAADHELAAFLESFGKAAPQEPSETDPLSPSTLSALLKIDPKRPGRLLKDESDSFEAKETFHTKGAQFAKYARTAAGFANAGGGYLVFGVKDETLEVTGLADDRFTAADKAELTQRFDHFLAPAIQWDRTTFDIAGKTLGVIYVYSALRKPVVSRMESDGLRDGAIYYRYIGATREVRSAELGEILGARDRRAGEDLAQVVSRVSNIGVQNVGIFDIDAGRVEGARGSFMIDENLLPKLRFVKEGEFAETKGAPTLRLIGDVETVEAGKVRPIIVAGRALSEYDIVRDFIEQKVHGDPKQYIRHQLHLQYKILPLFFYAAKAGLHKSELTELVRNEPYASKHTLGKVCARVSGAQCMPPESRKNYEDVIAKLLSGETPRVTPENSIKLAKALRALTPGEIEKVDVFKVLRLLLAAHDENPDRTLYGQIRLTASFVDETIFGRELAP
jgi:hypothetical protein